MVWEICTLLTKSWPKQHILGFRWLNSKLVTKLGNYSFTPTAAADSKISMECTETCVFLEQLIVTIIIFILYNIAPRSPSKYRGSIKHWLIEWNHRLETLDSVNKCKLSCQRMAYQRRCVIFTKAKNYTTGADYSPNIWDRVLNVTYPDITVSDSLEINFILKQSRFLLAFLYDD